MINWIFVMVVLGASFGLILTRKWKWSIGFLAAQYLGVFWFVHSIWPISLAFVKLISGLIVCLSLATSQKNTGSFADPETSWPQGSLFRLLATGLVVLTSLAVASQASSWLGISNLLGTWASLLLLGMGLLQLGITTQPMRVIIALLTLLSGFEILYAFVESSSLVAVMLVLINLGLVLVGIYLFSPVSPEDTK